MLRIKSPYFLGLTYLLCLTGFAQTAPGNTVAEPAILSSPANRNPNDRGPVLRLDSILAVIDAGNPQLQTYGNRAASLRATAEGARSWMAPMVGAGTFMMAYPRSYIMEERDKGSVMISGEQAVPNQAKQRAQVAYQRSRASVEEAGRAVSFNQLRAQAKQLYYEWLVGEQKQAVLIENQQILQTMKKLADIRYPYSKGSLGNIYKAQARLYELDNMLLMVKAEIDQKRIGLNTLMNRPKTELFTIDTTLIIPKDLSLSEVTLIDTALIAGNRSDIRRMDQTIRSMYFGIEAQKAERRPEFRIRFDHMSPLDKGMPNQFTAMGMVTIPIAPWSSRMYKAEIKGMKYEIQAMQKEREAMLNETQGMVAAMQTELRNMKQQLDNYRERVIPTFQKNYQTLMIAYEQNKEQLPVVIDGWETLNMSQMDYLNRLQDYYRMIVAYERELEK
ncbi:MULTISPECIES: TolC family protein [Larkinella]|uniref:TolC family protein n=1 Tax=Larkinella punicea TaxID=2315727 RepID=A0A368JK94_9BACT|nr:MULTISPECIES: TolC family protein [Larkinella]RCR67104.1 TolC family protein [Larkinella punicea]